MQLIVRLSKPVLRDFYLTFNSDIGLFCCNHFVDSTE